MKTVFFNNLEKIISNNKKKGKNKIVFKSIISFSLLMLKNHPHITILIIRDFDVNKRFQVIF